MSKKKIRNLIERQNAEEKEALWRRLEAELEGESVPVTPQKKRFPNFWKVFSACATSVALIVGLGVGLGLGLNHRGGDIAGPPDTHSRYCDVADCEIVKSEYTLKQYAELYGVDLVYLDWYDAEDYEKHLYKLKDNGEPVCLQEQFADPNFNYVSLFVTDNRTEMDFLTWYNEETGETAVMNGISVYYQEGQKRAVNFEYKGYRYYLKLSINDFEYLLQIVETMLNNH